MVNRALVGFDGGGCGCHIYGSNYDQHQQNACQGGLAFTCLAFTCLAFTCLAFTCLAFTCLAFTCLARTHVWPVPTRGSGGTFTISLCLGVPTQGKGSE
jgi:hypothetical protein